MRLMAGKRSKLCELAQQSLREGRLEGIIDVPKSGRWGNWEYYMRGGKQCCRRHGERKKSRTPAQGQARDDLGAASRAWKKLSEAQRRAWNAAGAQELSKPRLGQRGALTGQLAFTRRASVLLELRKELPYWPTAKPVFQPKESFPQTLITSSAPRISHKI